MVRTKEGRGGGTQRDAGKVRARDCLNMLTVPGGSSSVAPEAGRGVALCHL